jgi:hypothetical protein
MAFFMLKITLALPIKLTNTEGRWSKRVNIHLEARVSLSLIRCKRSGDNDLLPRSNI